MPIIFAHTRGHSNSGAKTAGIYILSGKTTNFQNWQARIPTRNIPGWFFVFMLVGLLMPGLFIAPADAQTRKLKIYFVHTGERSTIAYKRNGKYLKAGLRKINYALRDWRRNEPTKMDPNLLDLIWEIYRQSGSKAYINVVSAYRSPATNNMLRRRSRGVAKKSQHTLGKAIDFFLPDVKLSKLRKIGLIEQLGGVGYYPRSGSPFIHIDTGRVRHWPRMTRRELVRVFPRGNTMHIPTDGKPLKGYNKAVAAYNSKKSSGNRVAAVKGNDKQRKSFFQRLASLRNDEEDEVFVKSVTAPRKVRTSTKPVGEDDKQAPKIPDNSPSQPVLPVNGNTPVPRSLHRENIPVPAQNNKNNQDNNPADELKVANIPVPAIRPQYVPVLVAQAQTEVDRVQTANNNQNVNDEVKLVSIANEQLRMRLIAQAKAQLRTSIGDPPRPSANVGFETAFLRTQVPAQTSNNPSLTRSMAPATQNADKKTIIDDVLVANSRIPSPEPSPAKSTILAASVDAPANNPVDPFSIIPLKRPVSTNGVNDTAGQSQYVMAFATDEPDTLASPENLRDLIEKQSQELAKDKNQLNDAAQVEEPVQTQDAISDVILAAIPTPSPRPELIKSVSTQKSKPIIAAPVTDVASLDLPSSQPDAKALAAPKPLDELSLAWYEQDKPGRFVLASSVTIDTASAMRAPAYGRAAIRQTPNTVLTAGFNPSGSVQHSSSFTGAAIYFQTFTRFN